MGLYVGIITAKQLLGPFNCQIFHHVHTFAAAIVPLSGVAFGVLVGQNRSHG